MKRLVCLALVLAAAPLSAQEVPAEGRSRHDVRRGDTLWDLAAQYLGDPFRWPELYELNRDIVRDPHWIYPKESLRIPGYNYPASPRPAPARTVFFDADTLEEAATTLRTRAAAQRPAVLPGDFRRAALLVPEGVVAPLGRIEELRNPSVVQMHLPAQIAPFDRVYLSLTRADLVRAGDTLQLIRPGRRLEPYGRVFLPTGTALVVAVEGAVATAEVRELYDVVRVGDLALPVVAPPARPAGDARPAAALEATLLGFEVPHVVQATQERAFLDVGRAAGVEEGDEFVAYLPAQQTRWGVRPEVPVARLQVVRISERTATARVVSLEQPALAPGVRARRVGSTQ